MAKEEITTADLLAFMQENMATKQDLAQQKHEILDVMDRKFEAFGQQMDERFKKTEQRMDERFEELESKLDFKFDTLTDVLQEKDIISSKEAKHLKTLKPLILKTEA